MNPRRSAGTDIWRAYLAAFFLAAAVHATAFLFFRQTLSRPPEFAVASGSSSLQVDLVAAAPPNLSTSGKSEPAVPPLPEPQAPPRLPAQKPSESPAPTAASQLLPPESAAKPKVSAPPKPSRKTGTDSHKIAAKSREKNPPAAAASGAFSAPPGYFRNPPPAYPKEARRAKQEGVVMLRVSVNSSGKVTAVRLERSSGYPALDRSALTTVKTRWMFKPALANGRRVPAEVSIPVRFSLD